MASAGIQTPYRGLHSSNDSRPRRQQNIIAWSDDVSLADAEVFKHDELLRPKQITDRYLLALAVRNNGRLVTFDQGIRPTAVIGASVHHLVQLPG